MRVLCISPNIAWPLEKEEKSRQQKNNNQQHKQAACTTTSTERCAHCTAHFSSREDSRSLYTAVYISAFRRMRHTHSAVVCKAYRSNDACSEKLTRKRASCQQSIRRTKKRRVRFGSSEERRPRDASPVSVVFGVDRGQVFGVVAARTTTRGLLPLLLLLLL